MRNRHYFRSKAFFLVGWAIIPLFVLSCSCGKSVQNNAIHKDTASTEVREIANTLKSLIVYDTQKDSVHVKDSTIVSLRGDTVTIDRWHTKYVYRNIGQTIRDTVIIGTERDSARVSSVSTKETQKTVEKKRGGGIVHTVSFLVLILVTTFLAIYIFKSKKY